MQLTNLLRVLILAVACIPGAAFAGDWYVGVSGGFSTYSSGLTGGSSATESGYDLIGGYRLSRHWALEASRFDMGSADTSTAFQGVDVFTQTQTSTDTDGFALSAIGTLPFGDTWSGFVILGAADSHTKVTTEHDSTSPIFGTTSSSTSESATKVGLSYGVGLQADTGGAWTFRLGWRTMNHVGDSSTTGSGNVSLAFLSALRTF